MKSILLSMLAVAAFCSCSKDEAKPDPKDTISSETQSVSLTLSLGELDMTKAVGPAVDHIKGTVANIGTDIFVQALSSADDDATVLGEIPLTLSTHFGAVEGGNTYTSLAGAIIFPIAATHMRVIANNDNGTTLTDNINTRQGLITAASVRVIGVGEITGDGTSANPKVCAVTISPDMARIEVKGKLTGSTSDKNPKYVNNVKLVAIYLNNTIMTRDAKMAGISRNVGTASGWTSDPFTSAGDKKGLFDAFTPAIDAGEGFKSEDAAEAGYATGYNIFTQTGTVSSDKGKEDATKFHPHMIFKFSLQKANLNPDGTVKDYGNEGTYYLNVVAFRSAESGTPLLTTFVKGKVYQFELSDIYDNINGVYPTKLTTSPDPETAGIELVVTVGSWTVSTVTPEI